MKLFFISGLWLSLFPVSLLAAEKRLALPTDCVAEAKLKNAFLEPPASATDMQFFRCGAEDKVLFRVRCPYPDESFSDLITKRWESKGWLPTLRTETGWKTIASADRMRLVRTRELIYENSKKQRAVLILAYEKKLESPWPVGMTTGEMDFGDDLHVEMRVTANK